EHLPGRSGHGKGGVPLQSHRRRHAWAGDARTGGQASHAGPAGRGLHAAAQVRHIVVLGRGVGLATLAPLAELASTAGVGVTAILSARNSASLMSQDRFAAIGATLIEVTDAAGTSSVENVERLLRELHAAGRADAFYTCGSARLTALMRR